MLWAQALHVPVAVFAVLGLLVIVGRLRAGRRTAAQWLALIGFGSWSVAAALNAGWSLLEAAGVDVDVRYLAVNLLNVICVLAVSLVITTFGVRQRLRPVFVVAAVAACWVVWWLPGHGAMMEQRAQTTWETWTGMGLYLGYLAASASCLLVLGRAQYRVHLPLVKQVQLRLLQAMAGAGLTYVGTKALLFVGVQVGWPGFSADTAARILEVLLVGFALLFWMALAPPDGWLRLARRIEEAEAHAFATTFALQTKDDLAEGYDLGQRSQMIALAEQVARVQGFGFDDLARLRLASALLHTRLELRAIGELGEPVRQGPYRADEAAASRGIHAVLARTVWVPADVLQVLHEMAAARPRDAAARVLKVVDRFVALVGPRDPGDEPDVRTVQPLAVVEREFPGWAEVAALRGALWPGDGR